MSVKESGLEAYVAFVSELYKMPFHVTDMPGMKTGYGKRKTLGEHKSSGLLPGCGGCCNFGPGSSGHQGMPSMMAFRDS